jgi:hypothetical protein
MRKHVLTFALSTCLFVLIVAAKWATFDKYGSPMPDWDQWDAEALELFIPWFEKDHFLQHLFHPHNEHRVILTKLQNLALVLISGQWDSRLEAVTNAMLHAALAVAFWGFGRRWVGARWRAPLFLLIAALFGLPLAWQNVLGGFHSQQYWLLGLSFVAIALLPFARLWSTAWWLGVFTAVLSMGSMGSGFLAAAVVILVLGWRFWRGELRWRELWPTLTLMAALVIVGMLTRVEVDWHQKLKAKTAHDFFFSIVHSLQWPLRESHWAAAVLWAPWLLVAWSVLRAPPVAVTTTFSPERFSERRDDSVASPSRASQTIVALGGWVLVQIVATAYARGVGADYPASRYMDTLVFGATANAIALGWLLANADRTLWARIAHYAIGLAWLVTFGLGLHEVCERNFRHELPDAKKYYIKAEGHMRRYLATNDRKQLAYPDIPFPSADGLVERLARPSLRQLMPLPIRAPLEMTPDAAGAMGRFELNNGIDADPENPPRRGLSPKTPPLDYTPTWGSFGPVDADAEPRSWKSAPLTATLGDWLKFETAGDLTSHGDGVRLELQDAATGKMLATIAPTRVPGDSWRATYVRAPRAPFVVAATDRSRDEWLAFSAPVEMSHASYLAWQATKHGMLLLIIAGITTLIVAAACAMSRSKSDRAAELR